jgi:pyruvate dehydrogenase E1 component alpha subunit
MSFLRVNHNNIKNKKKLIPRDINIKKNTSLKLYRFAKKLRIIEERLAKEYHPANEMKCPVHFCIGQEAVPAVLSLVLSKKDFLFSHHRSHGYYLSKKSPLKKLVAELYGKKNGANGGLAGSQDISYNKNNFYSGAILAGSIGIAVGNAMAQKIDNKNGITVVGFGESACDVGLFWESVNYAFLKKLPILFICENNNYSVFSPQNKRQAGGEIFEKVKIFGRYSEKIFGNNICSLYKKINNIVKSIRKKSHPFFLEVLTYRFSSHYGPQNDIDIGYRTNKEVNFWKEYCPVTMLENKLIKNNFINTNTVGLINKKFSKDITEAINYSKKSNFSKKLNIYNLNYNSTSDYKKEIIKVDKNLKTSILSKKKIIGY